MDNLDQDIKDTKVRLCLDCGKCTVVCPVAQYDSDFNPRLIIQKRLGKPIWEAKDESIWSCLNCLMCVERCNYQVKFPGFIHSLREESIKSGTHVQCTHGGILQSAMHIMAKGNIKQERLDWLPEDIYLTEQSDTRFFVGCAPYFDVVFKDLGVNTLDGVIGSLKLLNEAKIPFNLLANERCCGRDLLLQGDKKGFKELASANIDEFSKHGVKKIITYCPECYACLKEEYPKLDNKFNLEIVNIFELLAPLIKNKKLDLKKQEKNVTYQDPCTLGRGFRIFEEPRQLIEAIPGMKLFEMNDNRETSLCCGANPWVYCNTVNQQIQKKRLAQAKDTGGEMLITACPKCQIHLKCAQMSQGNQVSQIEIRDLASLAAGALNRR